MMTERSLQIQVTVQYDIGEFVADHSSNGTYVYVDIRYFFAANGTATEHTKTGRASHRSRASDFQDTEVIGLARFGGRQDVQTAWRVTCIAGKMYYVQAYVVTVECIALTIDTKT